MAPKNWQPRRYLIINYLHAATLNTIEFWRFQVANILTTPNIVHYIIKQGCAVPLAVVPTDFVSE